MTNEAKFVSIQLTIASFVPEATVRTVGEAAAAIAQESRWTERHAILMRSFGDMKVREFATMEHAISSIMGDRISFAEAEPKVAPARNVGKVPCWLTPGEWCETHKQYED